MVIQGVKEVREEGNASLRSLAGVTRGGEEYCEKGGRGVRKRRGKGRGKSGGWERERFQLKNPPAHKHQNRMKPLHRLFYLLSVNWLKRLTIDFFSIFRILFRIAHPKQDQIFRRNSTLYGFRNIISPSISHYLCILRAHNTQEREIGDGLFLLGQITINA